MLSGNGVELLLIPKVLLEMYLIFIPPRFFLTTNGAAVFTPLLSPFQP